MTLWVFPLLRTALSDLFALVFRVMYWMASDWPQRFMRSRGYAPTLNSLSLAADRHESSKESMELESSMEMPHMCCPRDGVTYHSKRAPNNSGSPMADVHENVCIEHHGDAISSKSFSSPPKPREGDSERVVAWAACLHGS